MVRLDGWDATVDEKETQNLSKLRDVNSIECKKNERIFTCYICRVRERLLEVSKPVHNLFSIAEPRMDSTSGAANIAVL